MRPSFLLRSLMSLSIAKYFWVAGTGFVLDTGTFTLLHVGLGMPTVTANMCGGAAGVAFVYFVSARNIFLYKGEFLLPKFVAYLAYQATVIIIFSALIAQISSSLDQPALLVKLCIVPVQFVMNYLALRQILRMFEWA